MVRGNGTLVGRGVGDGAGSVGDGNTSTVGSGLGMGVEDGGNIGAEVGKMAVAGAPGLHAARRAHNSPAQQVI